MCEKWPLHGHSSCGGNGYCNLENHRYLNVNDERHIYHSRRQYNDVQKPGIGPKALVKTVTGKLNASFSSRSRRVEGSDFNGVRQAGSKQTRVGGRRL
jgi:hypothetical protein